MCPGTRRNATSPPLTLSYQPNVMNEHTAAHPCIFHQTPNDVEGSHLACPTCQDAFRTLDFDAMHTNLMNYLRSMGATIVPVAEPAL